MARGRMLNKNVATDEKVQSLSDISALLYTLMIPFQDKSGRFYANPNIIKGTCVPYRKSFTLRRIGLCIKEIEGAGLIVVYGKYRQYMQFNGFLKNNKPHPHEAESTIPSQEDVMTLTGKCRVNLDELNLDKIRLDESSVPEEKEDDTGKNAKILLDYFFNKYLDFRKVKYVVKGKKDTENLKTLLKTIPFDELHSLIDDFFLFQDDFLPKTDYGIGVFYSIINKLRQNHQVVEQKTESVDMNEIRMQVEEQRRQREMLKDKKDNEFFASKPKEEQEKALMDAEIELKKKYGDDAVIQPSMIKIEAIKILRSGKKPF